ncbi:MAG: hypothetical protein IKS90_03010 [Clostridia bacterium]|nr:hypothetical protein [Clostridia bacterium]
MKRLLLYKTAVLLTALAFSALLAACGSFGGDKPKATPAPSAITGSEITHGKITVLVPDGMEIQSAYDVGETSVCIVNKTEPALKQFFITVVEPGEEGSIEAEIKSYKQYYKGEDSVVEAGGAIWTGVSYKLTDSVDCFRVYGIVDSRTVYVYSVSYAVNSAEANAILGSLRIAK